MVKKRRMISYGLIMSNESSNKGKGSMVRKRIVSKLRGKGRK